MRRFRLIPTTTLAPLSRPYRGIAELIDSCTSKRNNSLNRRYSLLHRPLKGLFSSLRVWHESHFPSLLILPPPSPHPQPHQRPTPTAQHTAKPSLTRL
ncbi:hypothetical protein K443DRAFT_597331 [Laccaria amethystina LaAM-08-1]|uniref:Uncharacterized protein n=1 Tax=Laccaria amethystina LaAM-08-1 TaxID=1095629 RepID=A0A0C9XSF8_9AGAR|nr:hypothetical protein K443DRAFT_597331 [Laccaria amethystina LaAM-08-1]